MVISRRSGFPRFSLRRLARTRSTQDVVRRAAIAGAPEGFCCVADEQLAGRGRQGRAWSAPAGSSLLASLLLRRPPSLAAGVPFAAGIALVDAIGELSGAEVRVKWPNDVLAGGRKLAGILCEVEPAASTSGELAIVVGIGVNLRVPAFPPGVAGASLHELAPPPEALDLLDAWLDLLAPLLTTLEAGGIAGLRDAWLDRAVGIGSPVRAEGPSGEVSGVALDLDDDGALVVGTETGPVRVLAGDVHLTTPEP